MRIGIGAPPRGTPGSGAGTVTRLLSGEPWITNKQDGRQGERVVTDWSWDDSGTTLRLKLRRDVFFHDGTQLTPAVAAEALRESVRNPARDGLSFLSVQSITPIGEDAVDLKLSAPNSFIIPDLSGVLVVKPGSPDIATGPFQIVRQTEQESELAAFAKYYRGRPGISRIEVKNYPTQRNAWAALMRGEIDMLHEVSREAAEFVEAETTVKTYSFTRPYYIPLVFNVRHSILKNPEVRKAINEALDRAVLIQGGMSNRGKPAESPVWPMHWAYSAPPRSSAADPAAASRRLDAAGLPTRIQEDGRPARFSFSCLVFANDTRFERLELLVQKQLADVGIDMKLVPVPIEELGRRTMTGDFDAFIFEMAGRSLSRVYDFWRYHPGALNNSGYHAADAVLDRIQTAKSDAEIRDGVAELERILHDDPPAAFLAWQETARAVSAKFDVLPEENRDILTNVWQWRAVREPQQASR